MDRDDLGTAFAGVVETSRGAIGYWEVGDGPPVLCIHGFPDHPVGMLPFARDLAAAGNRCLCPALPGYWPSSAPARGGYTMEEVATDLLEFNAELALDRPALVGHDWGACLGYLIGDRHPEAISRLVALAAPPPAGFVHRRTLFTEQQTAWYALLLAYGSRTTEVIGNERWLTALTQSWSPGFYWRGWDEVCGMLLRPGVLDSVGAYYRADLESALKLGPVRVPTTVIFGGQDGCIRPLAYEQIETCFEAGLRKHLMPSAGHWPHLEDPEAVTALIVAALGRD